MRRNTIFALMTALTLLLSACGDGNDSEKFQKFRDGISGSTGNITAVVCGEHGGTRNEYKLSFTGDENESQILVLEPAEIENIKVTITEDGKKAQFEDIVLPMGDTDCAVSPVTALPAVFTALKSGWVNQIWREELEGKPCLAADLVYDGKTSVRVWMDFHEMIPVYGEIISDSDVCISCKIIDWSIE